MADKLSWVLCVTPEGEKNGNCNQIGREEGRTSKESSTS